MSSPQYTKKARAIPIDKSNIQRLSARLINKLGISLKKLKSEIVLRKQKFQVQTDHVIRAVDGSFREVLIFIRVDKFSQKTEYITAGGFGWYRDGRPVIIININGSFTPEEILSSLFQSSDIIKRQIYKVLIHEITHASDILSKATYEVGSATEEYTTKDLKAYYNDPNEVRAFMREVIEEVLDRYPIYEKVLSKKGNKGISLLLKQSKTWNKIKSHLNLSNKKKILKSVWQHLHDEGFLR